MRWPTFCAGVVLMGVTAWLLNACDGGGTIPATAPASTAYGWPQTKEEINILLGRYSKEELKKFVEEGGGNGVGTQFLRDYLAEQGLPTSMPATTSAATKMGPLYRPTPEGRDDHHLGRALRHLF